MAQQKMNSNEAITSLEKAPFLMSFSIFFAAFGAEHESGMQVSWRFRVL